MREKNMVPLSSIVIHKAPLLAHEGVRVFNSGVQEAVSGKGAVYGIFADYSAL